MKNILGNYWNLVWVTKILQRTNESRQFFKKIHFFTHSIYLIYEDIVVIPIYIYHVFQQIDTSVWNQMIDK